MIFNGKEVVDVLKKYLFNSHLTGRDIILIKTLIYYLEMEEPKITHEEFNELFKVEKKPINDEIVELKVVPKNTFYVRIAGGRLINDAMSVSAEVQEFVQDIAYSEFYKVLDNLKEK